MKTTVQRSRISGFSYIHNAIESGLPIIEAIWAVMPYVHEMVAVDCESTDETRQVLERIGVRVIDGKWGNQAGETLAQAHALHRLCEGDTIIHFEADEVFDDSLIREVVNMIETGLTDLSVYRIQVEQNLQRVRWYPEPVHRIYPRGSVIKEGHTTNRHKQSILLPEKFGLLWDVTNNFGGNWLKRVENQAKLWNREEPKYRMVPYHFMHPVELSRQQAEVELLQLHWGWRTTPLNIPKILRPLLGVQDYRQSEAYRKLMG